MEKDLNKVGKDTCNLKFWRVYATPNTLAPLAHEHAEKQFSTAAVERAANILGNNNKWTFGEVNDEEEPVPRDDITSNSEDIHPEHASLPSLIRADNGGV